MPPKKRARHSRTTTATASPPAKTTSPSREPTPSLDQNSAWTDAEETALFRALLRYKPTGLHKHQRLIALHSWLLSNNHIHPSAPHTRPAGIWAKLGELYDLAALDAREDARQLERIPGVDESGVTGLEDEYSEAENLIEVEEFRLPVSEDETVREMVWGRRLGVEGEESEAEMPELNFSEEVPRVVDLSTGRDPVEVNSPKKVGRVRGKKEERRGSLVPSRRSARQAESTADEVSVDGRLGEEDEEEGGEESEGEESRASTPAAAARSTRSKGAAKGGTKGKGRARAKGK